jgi:FkbM family methyltransferase
VESNLKKYEESLNIKFFNFALGSEDKNISFYAVDRDKYDNQGIGSFYKVNFDNRLRKDPDYKRGTVQKEINISQKKYESLQLTPPDLLAMDVQGAELEVLKGFEDQLKKIKIIILETSISDNYIGGASFIDVHKYLRKNFKLIKNSRYPTKKSRIFQDHIKYKLSKNKIFQNDFDLLYVNKSID